LSTADRLTASLTTELPDRLAVGAGNVLFLEGRASHPSQAIERLEVLVAGRAHPVSAHGMPEPKRLAAGEVWWATVPLEALSEPAEVPLALRARLANGAEARAELASLRLTPGVLDAEPAPAPAGLGERAVAVAMATYNPPPELFRRQIDSIRSQTHPEWVCVISDDCSDPGHLEAIREVLGDDPRFRLHPSPVRLGFYRNFERALALVPPDVPHVALCDQDDRWYPEKLAALVDGLGPARLVYSDMRIVEASGAVVSETYWRYRRNNHTDFASLLIANTITGAASLFPRELLELALPFPPRLGNAFHDHWIATVALATGEVRYVDRPLYDYVQHGESAIGHAGANAARSVRPNAVSRARRRLRHLRANSFRPGWRAIYFNLYTELMLWVRLLDLRCGDRIDPPKRRVIDRLLACERSPAGLAWLVARAARPLFGADETFGRERHVVRAVLWRHMTRVSARVPGRAAARR
jgi:glycosyltransferase involved in cell wall biosynthesis